MLHLKEALVFIAYDNVTSQSLTHLKYISHAHVQLLYKLCCNEEEEKRKKEKK